MEIIQPSATIASGRPLTQDLRTAAAMVREGDWRGFVHHFDGHDFAPLAALADAVQSALYSLPCNQIGPDQIIVLAHMHARDVVSDWLAIFGCR